jgi:hypothetical protein
MLARHVNIREVKQMKAIKVSQATIDSIMVPLKGGGVRDPTTTYKGRNKFAQMDLVQLGD